MKSFFQCIATLLLIGGKPQSCR